MYKYLLFDLDETLLDFKKAETMAITQILSHYKIPPTQKTIELYSSINKGCWDAFEKGEITREEVYINRFILLGEKLGINFDPAEINEKYSFALSKQGQIFPNAIWLLNKLKQEGYIIAAATNGSLVAQTGRLLSSGLSGFFGGGIYISEKVGYKKPQPEFFEHILNKLNNPPKNQVLVLGDSLNSDIKGALAANLDCCLVDLENKYTQNPIKPTYIAKNLKEIYFLLKN